MSSSTLWSRRRRDISALVLLLVLLACRTPDFDPSCSSLDEIEDRLHRFGIITVEQPEVWSRARLVPFTDKERKWLEELWSRGALSTEFQGRRDIEQLTRLVAALKATVDPTKLGSAQQQGQLGSKQLEAQLLEQQGQIERLQKELEGARRAGAVEGATAGSEKEKAAHQAQPAKPGSTEQGGATAKSAGGSGGTAALLERGADQRRLGEALETPVELSGFDQITDELDVRQFLHAKTRAAAFDDLTDLFGYTAYLLEFDVTVLPGRYTREKYLGEVTLRPYVTSDAYRRTLDKILETVAITVTRKVNFDVATAIRSLEQDGSQAFSDQIALVADLVRHTDEEAICKEVKPSQDSTEPEACQASEERSKNATELAANIKLERAGIGDGARKLVRNLVVKDYQKRYEGFLEFICYETPAREDENVSPIFFVEARPANEARCAFVREFKKQWRTELPWPKCDDKAHSSTPEAGTEEAGSEGAEAGAGGPSAETPAPSSASPERPKVVEFPVYTYALNPQEKAENISDVFASERLYQFQAVVSTLLGPAGNTSLDVNYLKDIQKRASAIKRNPLALAFGRGGSTFGWILGPRFALDGDDIEFSHTRTRHKLTAILVVPGFLDRLNFMVQTNWVRKPEPCRLRCDRERAWTRERQEALLTRVDSLKPIPGESLLWNELAHQRWKEIGEILPLRKITTALPYDPRTVVNYLGDRDGGIRMRRPLILSMTPRRLPQGDLKRAAIIRGVDLWKSPEVLIGGVQIDSKQVTVLPDLSGLLVKLDPVPGRSGENLSVTVATVYGKHTVPGFLEITDPVEPADKMNLRLLTLRASTGSPISVGNGRDWRKLLFHSARLELRPKSGPGGTISAALAVQANGEALFAAALPTDKLPDDAGVYVATVTVVPQPGARARAHEVTGAIVLVKGKTHLHAKANTPRVGSRQEIDGLMIDLPRLFADAYPGFDRQQARLIVRGAGIPQEILMEPSGTRSLRLSEMAANQLEAIRSAKDVQLTLDAVESAGVRIPIAASLTPQKP